MRSLLTLLVVLALVVSIPVLAGCGSGGNGGADPEPQGNAITGKIDTSGAPGSYDVLLDGVPVPGAARADGSFVIEGVPPGDHRVAAIERGGNSGAYVSVVVVDGRDAITPDLRPELGGQIVGIVTVVDDDGIRPLAGVEVIAVASGEIAMAQPTPGETRPETYPPPPLAEFSAFTEDDGSYRIRAIPPGDYTVTVAVPDYREGWQWVWVGEGQTAAADFRLRPAVDPGVGTVQGRVMGVHDGLAEPIEGATVTIFSDVPWEPIGPICPPGDCVDGDPGESEDSSANGKPEAPDPPLDMGMLNPPWFPGVSTLTDSNGRYSLNAPAGYASIEVWAQHHEPVWDEIAMEADQTQTRNFTLNRWQEFPYPEPPPHEVGPGSPPIETEEG